MFDISARQCKWRKGGIRHKDECPNLKFDFWASKWASPGPDATTVPHYHVNCIVFAHVKQRHEHKFMNALCGSQHVLTPWACYDNCIVFSKNNAVMSAALGSSQKQCSYDNFAKNCAFMITAWCLPQKHKVLITALLCKLNMLLS